MPSQKYCYEFPRPAVTVDAVVLAIWQGAVSVLVIERKSPPFAGRLALPGGFLELDEPGEQAARRELAEETGVTTDQPMHPLGFYDAPGRDPRGRTISLAFFTTVRPPVPQPVGSDDAAASRWNVLAGLESSGLAFDHGRILADALDRIRSLPPVDPLLLTLLPSSFRRDDLAALFSAVGLSAREALQRRRAWEKLGLIRASTADRQRYRSDTRRLKRLVARTT